MLFNINMKIMPVDTSHANKPIFQSSFRIYFPKQVKNFDIFGCNKVRTSTNLFREDLDWVELVYYMKHHFKNKDSVNTCSLACSDGSEAFTFAISVFENLPENIQAKFLPIHASDIDEEILKAAKSGRINIDTIEFLLAERMYNCDIEKYFNKPSASIIIKGDEISETDTISSYQVEQKLRNAVKFKKSDILTELNNLKDNGNSVILCRNVFPYLSQKYTDKVIETAQKKLKKGSLFIIGDYDGKVSMEQKLFANGFCHPVLNSKCVNGNNIFIRI